MRTRLGLAFDIIVIIGAVIALATIAFTDKIKQGVKDRLPK